MQHTTSVYDIKLIYSNLQIGKNKKLMQAEKSACKNEKNIVLLQKNHEKGTKNQKARLICYEDKSNTPHYIVGMLLLLKKDSY